MSHHLKALSMRRLRRRTDQRLVLAAVQRAEGVESAAGGARYAAGI